MQECAICQVEYLEEDEITPLPCNPNHYFHSACIEPWFKTKTECPLCRAPVTLEQLQA